uniref:DedA protein n=1 Tax=uncultured Nocardioidaceae bacterium TaxID=253824 RepID=A0A6J4MHV8_9ACTN|nr:MAG: DedA protein [uncultured Nocardioidaceae bacterium]
MNRRNLDLVHAPTSVQALGLDSSAILEQSSSWALWVTAAIIFAECALLLGFFLPGDTLLFSAGVLVSTGIINEPIVLVCVVLASAAVLGNAVGYEIGRWAGPALLERPNRLVTEERLRRTREFFDHHGPWAIVLARFVSVVRTLITVTAGAARMPRKTYLFYSAIGGVVWAAGLTALGYALGQVPFVQKYVQPYLDIVIVVLVLATVIPLAISAFRRRRKSAHEPVATATTAQPQSSTAPV